MTFLLRWPNGETKQWKLTSVGYFLWVVAKEYERIYKNHQDFGIWGHGIRDLFFEAMDINEDGYVELHIGS